MKIITWNCNGALRKKFQYLSEFNADINIVQECENPVETKHSEYREWAKNHLWNGERKNKGIGIFANNNILLEELNWSDKYEDQKVKHFLPCIVNQDFNLIAVWTHRNNSPTTGYIGQLLKYLQIHKSKLQKGLIIGDFNSNVFWDKKSGWWNHSDVVRELKEIGIESLYHKYWREEQGKETRPTLFLQKNLKKPYHIDYVFGSMDFQNGIKKMEVGEVHQWLKISDHMPLICEFKTEK